MEIAEVQVPGRNQQGMYVQFDDGAVVNLKEEHLQMYHKARLSYYLCGQTGVEPRLKDYALKFGEKVDPMEIESLSLSSVKPDTTTVDQPPAPVVQAQSVPTTAPPVALDVYAIRNADGKWFKKRGTSHLRRDDTGQWVDDPAAGRVWVKRGQAKAVVTYYARKFPNLPVPNLVRFSTTVSEVYDEAKRIAEAQERKRRADLRREEIRRKRAVEAARAEYERAKAKYEAELASLNKAVGK